MVALGSVHHRFYLSGSERVCRKPFSESGEPDGSYWRVERRWEGIFGWRSTLGFESSC